MIKALIFDFDGLILDTEVPHYEIWRRRYQSRGSDLPIEKWLRVVGSGFEAEGYDPCAELNALPGEPLDCQSLYFETDAEYLAEIARNPLLPGVEALIADAKLSGLKVAVASSSPRGWVESHLTQRGLLSAFDVIKTRDDVQRVKPNPDLFLAARDALGVASDEAIVLEDSLNGVKAGLAAGIYTIAVPNPVTAHTDLSSANWVVSSLAGLTIKDITAHLNGRSH